MTPSQAREAIAAACAAGVSGLSGSPLLILGSERGIPAKGSTWIRVAIRDLPSPPMTHGPAGSRRAERRGVLIGQCFVPHGEDDGEAAAVALAVAFRDLFEGTDLDAPGATAPADINFQTADLRVLGVDGAWVNANAEIPFTYDEIV